jgi:dihydropyrimidinase
MDLLIKGGIVVTPTDSFKADVGVDGGKIVAIGSNLGSNANDVVNAEGKYVLPGGIDAHTHMEMPFMGTTTIDDFEVGTVAAAFGGVTTILDFAMQPKGNDFLQTLSMWRQKADPKVTVDYGIHLAVTDLNENLIRQIPEIQAAGVNSFKLFMPYRKEGLISDDGRIFRMLEESRKLGFLVQVHAENNAVLEMLIDGNVTKGNLSAEFHAKSRPNFVEGEAIHRALALAAASGGNLYIVHMSTEEGVAELANLKGMANVYGETCPHYLTLTDEKYLSPKGRRYIMSPPLRSEDDREVLWWGLADGILSSIGTDHCAFTEAQKDAGRDNFTKVPNGVPGTETMIPLMFTEGVRNGRISLNKLVEVVSFNSARLFGLYPQKGTISIGSDADLVVFDPEMEMDLTASNLHSKIDYSIYEEFSVKGMPTHTFVRGNPVVYDRKFVGSKGLGKFVKCGKHQPVSQISETPATES